VFSWLKSRRARVGFALLLAILTLNYNPRLILLLSFGLVLLTYPQTLKPLRHWKFWLTIGLLIFLIPVFGRHPDARLWIVPYNRSLLIQTSLMAIRGILVFLLFQVLTFELRQAQLSAFFGHLGIPQFDRIYGVSKETIPKARSILLARYSQFKSQRPAGKLVQITVDLLTNILADFVRLAENLARQPVRIAGSTEPAALIQQVGSTPSLIILTGAPGAGKTTYLTRLTAELTRQHIRVDGLLSIRETLGAESWRQINQRIAGGKQHPLSSTEFLARGEQLGKYYFHPDAFKWAAEALTAAASTSDWFIVDEIGPLEMSGKGYLPVLTRIFSGANFPSQVVFTLRPGLLDQLDDFLNRWLPRLKDHPRIIIRVKSKTGASPT